MCDLLLLLPWLLLLLLQGSAAAEPKGRKMSARQRKQRNYAAMDDDDEYNYRWVYCNVMLEVSAHWLFVWVAVLGVFFADCMLRNLRGRQLTGLRTSMCTKHVLLGSACGLGFT